MTTKQMNFATMAVGALLAIAGAFAPTPSVGEKLIMAGLMAVTWGAPSPGRLGGSDKQPKA